MQTRCLLFALLILATPPAVAREAGIDCQARLRLDHILNAGVDVPPHFMRGAGADAPPVHRMYDIIESWAVAVAIGDYQGARLFGDRVLERLGELLAEVEADADAGKPEAVYARLAISATMARISLVDHALLPAVRYGRIARGDADWLLERRPHDMRASFFIGLYEYYTGVAPVWLRTIGALAGVHGDPEKGMRLIEDTVRSNNELAPEAARVLLAEVRPEDRRACRYLPLAEDLAARYPDNFRFGRFLERERNRCENHRLANPLAAEADGPRGVRLPRTAAGTDCIVAGRDPS